MKKIAIPNLSDLLNFKFQYKPLLIGGLAMEYYDLRKAGNDIDFILNISDYNNLKKNLASFKYSKLNNKLGDQGIAFRQIEMWSSAFNYQYQFLTTNAIEDHHSLIISLEKLLFLKSLDINKKKCRIDSRLLVEKILSNQCL